MPAFDPNSLIPSNSFTRGFGAANGLTNPFTGSEDASEQPGYIDRYADKFAKSNLEFDSNPLIAFQDPTYLGFKLMFLFDQEESGLLSSVSHTNTAVAFLERLGDTEKAYFIRQFVNTLRDVNTQCPWYFQAVSGLDEAWQRGFQEESHKAKHVRKLTIECLESVDLRVTALLDLYRKACFDYAFKREVVPWNLRTFTMYMYVYDGRSFNRRLTRTQQDLNRRLLGSREDPGNDVHQVNRLLFRFEECEILPDESGDFLSKVSNVTKDGAAQKLVIRYRHVQEENIYNLFSDKYVADEVIKVLDRASLDDPEAIGPVAGTEDERRRSFLDRVESVFENAASDLKDQALARARDLISGALGGVLLGNIYGLSPASLASALQGGVGGAIQAGARAIAGAGSSVANDTADGVGGVYFDNITPNTVGTPHGNIGGGESTANAEGQASGSVGGGPSLVNVDGEAGGGIGGGASLNNGDGVAGGGVSQGVSPNNGQPSPPDAVLTPGESPSNQDGVATGSIGGGQSLFNGGSEPSNGMVGGGQSLANQDGTPARNVYSSGQASRANVDGAASGTLGGGPSLANAPSEANGQVGGGESVNNNPGGPPTGQVGGGQSTLNSPQEATGVVGGGESRSNTVGSPDGQVGGGQSTSNLTLEAASGRVGGGESLSNTSDSPGGKVGGGESLSNSTQEADGNVFSGEQSSRPQSSDPASGQVGGGPSQGNTDTLPPTVDVGGGKSLQNDSDRANGIVGKGSPSSHNDTGEASDNVYHPK